MHKGSGIEVTAEELLMLTALLGSDFAIGLQDPYKGYLEEEREQSVRKTQLRLMEQGILVFLDDGEMGIEQNHAELAAACGFARTVCRLKIVSEQEQEQEEPLPLHDALYYFTQEMVVENKQTGEEPLRYELRSIGLPFECGHLFAGICAGFARSAPEETYIASLSALTWDEEKRDWAKAEAWFQLKGERILCMETEKECDAEEMADRLEDTVLSTLQESSA